LGRLSGGIKMRLTKRKIEKAKKILALAEEQKKQSEEALKSEQEKRIEERRKYREIISKHRDELANRLISNFEKENKPLFEAGEKVRINSFVRGNSWEGSLIGYLQNCDKNIGPAIVTISKVYTDKSYLYEILEEKMESIQYKMLEGIKEDNFEQYEKAWNTYNFNEGNILLIGYSYFVEYEGKNLTERYGAGFREPNFVRLGSDIDKLICEAYDLETKEKELSNQIKDIKKQQYYIQKKRNQMAKDNPNLGLMYICNFPKSEEEFLKKGWF
jgi:hypothetical protein